MNQQNNIEIEKESKYNFFNKNEINILNTFHFNVFIHICLIMAFFSFLFVGFDILNHKTSIEHNKELLSIIGSGPIKFFLIFSYFVAIIQYIKSCLMLQTTTVKNLSGGFILLISSIIMLNLPSTMSMLLLTLIK